MDKNLNVYKVALVSICINQPYWQYIDRMVLTAKKFFLKGHDVDYIVWSDMPSNNCGAKIIPTPPTEWPLPTLMRYHLFLQEEELLRQYDYVFFCDADMVFVARVGDEILGDGLTAAKHPMYAVNKIFVPPYEPNPNSSAYVKMPGRILIDGVPKFEPVYAAGGFQGGRTDDFIKAMKVMVDNINKDFSNNYTARWNDESHWNKYLYDNPPSVVLSPSYVYPDSLNKSYYQKVWGRNYVPRLVTVTKSFSLSKGGGDNLQQTLKNL